ncbi:hypothetical protein QBC46DRAFT_386147 [Diplogelasinospora grovesii]|uniref:F-box domain-containing protein n=1 Tax=Diplogelasinospora grovesii TaxID=303347 RepID=A0AAN6S4Y4_9PEZI|nr:hypothetical protein QBC46DRAFT_386147 [Diplogelasinospora grovesii]
MANKKKAKKPKNKYKNRSGHMSKAFGPPNPQEGSLLMQLPQELRDEIYSYLFFSTRISSGERAFGRIDHRRIVPIPNALALLRTCRRVHSEIGHSWLHKVLFSFEDPEAMLNKLANISIETRSMIRHVRVSGCPLVLSFEDDDVFYRTSAALKLLPGLKLDRLTVMGGRDSMVCYETLDKLVKHSDGWKELYYLSHNSTFLGYKDTWPSWTGGPDADRYLRVPQPAGWQKILEDRDGPASCPSVAIYRSTNPGRACSVLHADLRVPFVQTLAAGQNLAKFGKMEDAALMAAGEREKEVLVVVKRGRGLDYEEKEGSLYLPYGYDIRGEMPGMTWKQIKTELDNKYEDDEDWPFGDDDEEEPGLVDAYSHVDDYVWPPLHFATDE